MPRRTGGLQRGVEKRQKALDMHALFPSSDIQLIEQLLKEHNHDDAQVISILTALHETKLAPVSESASLVLASDSYNIYNGMFRGILSDVNIEAIWVEIQFASSTSRIDETELLSRAVHLALNCLASGLVDDMGPSGETKYFDEPIVLGERRQHKSYVEALGASIFTSKSVMIECSEVNSTVLTISPPQELYEDHLSAAQYWADVQIAQYKRMVECFTEAARAHSKGSKEDRGQAVVYAEKGRDHERKMTNARAMHCKSLFEAINYPLVSLKISAGKIEIEQIRVLGRRLEMDFHGLFVKEALDLLVSLLSMLNGPLQVDEIHLVVGKGNHSANNIPKIKVAFENFLSHRKYKYTTQEGTLTVIGREESKSGIK